MVLMPVRCAGYTALARALKGVLPTIALVVLGAASAASAQPSAEVAPLASKLAGDALTAYESGRLLFEDGDFRGALAQFKRAYELAKDPRLLWNMATCEKEQRHYGQAALLISQYLEAGGNTIPVERREEAAATLAALQSFVSTVELKGVPADATVTIDGTRHRLEALPHPFSLDLGSHTLTVAAPGYQQFERQFEVLGKIPLKVVVTMQPLPRVGHLRVEVVGGVGTIRLGNKVVGQGRFEGELVVGQHTLTIAAPGKETHEEQITIVAQGNRNLHITLQDESTRLWPWIVGGALLLAGGGVGGYFLFSDSESRTNAPTGSLGSL